MSNKEGAYNPVLETDRNIRANQILKEQGAEDLAAILMVTVEAGRDMVFDNPEIFGYKRLPVAVPGTDSWLFQHVGDVFETSALFLATRFSLTVVDLALRKVSKDKVSIPDDTCFWASMITGVLIPSLIELNQKLPVKVMPGYIGDPADLFGIGVASVVLIGSHYSKEIGDYMKERKNNKNSRQTLK